MGIANERFKAIRESLGLTQEAFAESIGISAANVRKLEHGDSLPIAHALKIHEKFGQSLDYIYGLTDSNNDPASTMLLCLEQLFGYQYDRFNLPEFPHLFILKQPVIDFLTNLAQADELLKNGMPQQAYDLWVAKLKDDFNAAMADETWKRQMYRLVEESQFRKAAGILCPYDDEDGEVKAWFQ